MVVPAGKHFVAALLALGCLFLAGCRPAQDDVGDGTGKREAILAESGDILVRLEWSPGIPRLDRDLLADLVVQTPAGTEAEIPPPEDRFQGFHLKDRYEEPPEIRDNQRLRRFRFRLRPQAGERLRLAPMPLRIVEPGTNRPHERWIATTPLVFETEPPPTPPESPPFSQTEPAYIPPTPATIAKRIAIALLALAAILAAVWFARRYYNESATGPDPRDLALRELAALLERDVLERGLFKDFYVELTLIVRRYIERAHGIRAPEQTTPEFLAQASVHPGFHPGILEKLRDFLEAADAVKFASGHADRETAGRAVQCARDYLDSDSLARRVEAADASPEAEPPHPSRESAS